MIVRVLGQGQWMLEVEQLEALDAIDRRLEQAVEDSDQDALRTALTALFDKVRELGTEVPDEVIAESDLVLPDPDATVEEVRALVDATTEYFGLIPDPFGADEQAAQA